MKKFECNKLMMANRNDGGGSGGSGGSGGNGGSGGSGGGGDWMWQQ